MGAGAGLFRMTSETGNAPTETSFGQLEASGNLQPSSQQVQAFEEASSALISRGNTSELPFEEFTPPQPGTAIISDSTGTTYTIGAMIGEGSFGYVYEAVDIWGNLLAAKVLKPRGTYEEIAVAANLEFTKLLQLRHPNVTHVHAAFEFKHTFYLVTERCTTSLVALFDLENLDGKQWLLPLARCVLQAVHFLHTHGYVHQDIHFGNIFAQFHRNEMGVAQDTSITFKLADFGITKLFEQVDSANTMLNPGMLPPEYLDNDFGPMDHRIDIYHCGLLFLQLLLGRQLQFTNAEIQSGVPRQLAEKLAEPYRTALSSALRRTVGSRTSNAINFWNDLNAVVEG